MELSEPLGVTRSQTLEPKAKILLVCAIPANLVALRSILENLGQNLEEVRSGEEALQRVNSDEFAVVLIDVRMPGTSDFETAKAIRGNDRSRHTPIIFLTPTDIDRPQIEEAAVLGAVDFLVRPFWPIILEAKVRWFIELFRGKKKTQHEAEQLQLMIEGAKDYSIFLLDPDGHVASWNAGAERIKQYRADEIIGEHFSRFYPQDAIERGWPAHELQVARAEGRFEDEGWRTRKDGTQFWANVVITALVDAAGNLRGFSKITKDLTERRRSEENARRLVEEAAARRIAEENARIIQQQREQLHVTLTSIGDAVITTDTEGRVQFLNAVAHELVGWKNEEASGRTLENVFHVVNEETRQRVENPALRALREGRIVGLANRSILISKDGKERPIDDSAAPIRDAHSNISGSVMVFRDVSEQRQAEQATRKNHEILQLVHKIGKIGQWEWNSVTDENRWSPEIESLYGLPPGGFEGGYQGWAKLLHPDDLSRAEEDVRRALQSGEYFSEFRVIWPDGSVHWLETRAHVFKDNNDKPVRIMGVNMDVTDRKRVEHALRFLADASATLAAVVNYESTLQTIAALAVPQFADWCTVDMAEADGSLKRLAVVHVDPAKVKLALELQRLYPPDPDSPRGLAQVLRTGEAEMTADISDALLIEAAKDDEHLRILRELGLRSCMCVPLKGRDRLLGAVSFMSAESRRRYTKDDLAFAEELARRAAIAIENVRLYAELQDAHRRKDEFLATLAHELRNPLAPIRSSLQILKMPQVDAETAQRTAEMMNRQVQHLVRLVDDLLDVSRVMQAKIELRKERVELASVIASAVETAQPLIEAQRHELAIALPAESLTMHADPVRLAQVVGNLLSNAAKYTEPHGRIWLTAQRESDQAVLRVRDNGIGIAPDMLPHVFELFVQADHAPSRSQGGLGVGLTLARNLVEMHHGTVKAYSGGLGKGSEFVIRLPLARLEHKEPEELERGEPRKSSPSSVHRLLVVDDNEDAAESLAMLLRLCGHEVRVAHSGPSALDMVKDYVPEIIFLDIGMPGLDGYEVARQLRQRPGLEHVVLAALTGWGQQEDRRKSTEAGFDHHLVKPVEPNTLEGLMAALKPPAQ